MSKNFKEDVIKEIQKGLNPIIKEAYFKGFTEALRLLKETLLDTVNELEKVSITTKEENL